MSALKMIIAPVRKHPRLFVGIGLVLFLLGALLAARLWIASDGGRSWLLSQIDGRKAGRYGTLTAEGLSGDPLGKLYLRRLSLRDSEGEWLVVQNLSVDWSPLALTSGLVDVAALSAGQVDLLRRPVLSERAPSDATASSSRTRIKLRSLNLPDLAFAEGFAGPEAHFVVSGRYDQQGRSLSARLEATPRDTGRDQLLVDIHREATGPFGLDVDINGAPDGTLANLIGLDTGLGVTLKAQASGTLENAQGEAALSIGDTQAAKASLKIHESRLTADAEIDSTGLPQLGRQAVALVGDAATLRLESTTGRRNAPFGIEAVLRTGTVSIRGDVDTRTWKLNDPASLDVQIADISPLLSEPGSLSFTGTAAQDGKDWLFQGKSTLSVSGKHAFPFERAWGPIKATLTQTDLAFTVDLKAEKAFAGNDALAGLMGETSALHVAGRYDRASQLLSFGESDVALAAGRVSTTGTIDLAGKSLDLKGTLSTALDALPGGTRGQLSGPFSVKGPLGTPDVEVNLAASDFSGLPAPLDEAVGAAPTLNAALHVQKGGLRIDSARLTGRRAILTAAGLWAWTGNSDVRASLTQSAPVTTAGWTGSLGTAQVRLTGRPEARRFDLRTSGGAATGSGRRIDDITLTADLSGPGTTLAGPVRIRANVDGEPFSADARLARLTDRIRLDEISGTLGPGAFGGTVLLGDSGDMDGDLTVDGTALTWNSGRVRKASGTLRIDRAAGQPVELDANLDVEGLELGPGDLLYFDRASARVRTAPEGYDIHANASTDSVSQPTDLTLTASAVFGEPAASGLFELSGLALGEPIATAAPAHWRLGDTPELDADIAILSGRIKAGFTGAGDDTHLVFDATGIDLGPVLALYEAGADRTHLEGRGDLRVFGAAPSGTIHMVAASDVPGLDSSLLMNVDGTLDTAGLSLRLTSDYGGRLALRGETLVPVTARAGQLVALNRSAPLQGSATLQGDLAVLRTAALAFGHDISGTIDASATLAGSLEAPAITGKAHVDDGTYELGSLGFQLSGVSLDAAYDGTVLTLEGKAGAPGGGNFSVNGKLAGQQTSLTTEFANLLVYNRDGDHLRGTGTLVLADSKDERTLTGNVFIDQARFSLDNLPSARPKALDVRWTDDPPAEPGESQLRRTMALDVALSADRRVYITGRGLDSEWQIDLKLTGTPAAPLLNGKTTLVRGDLDLAGRPFVFDSGRIDFDGPATRARMAIFAERTVNGFDARVDVTGSPVKPVFELSSSPELPQDEILSRLLFGRSTMDLSPLEAAQLASSIARLSGSSGGMDLTGGVQAALGLDRLSIGTSETGGAEIGVGQYLSEDVYLELKSAGADGSSVEVEWQPRPHVSVSSETQATGESKVSIRWKKDY